MPTCTGVLLAAGSSRRFGTDKRLHLFAGTGDRAQPLAMATVRVWINALAHDALSELIVVTRGQSTTTATRADPLDALIHEFTTQTASAVRVVNAPDAALGMGHSLAAAMPFVLAGPAIVGLADMPWVEPATIKKIAHQLRLAGPDAIVRPSYRGKPGNPIGFGAQWHQALGQSTGDQGARAVVQQAERNHGLTDLPVPDSGVLRDIDTTADLAGI